MKWDIGGVVVPLIDSEDLIIAKLLAGRPKDRNREVSGDDLAPGRVVVVKNLTR